MELLCNKLKRSALSQKARDWTWAHCPCEGPKTLRFMQAPNLSVLELKQDQCYKSLHHIRLLCCCNWYAELKTPNQQSPYRTRSAHALFCARCSFEVSFRVVTKFSRAGEGGREKARNWTWAHCPCEGPKTLCFMQAPNLSVSETQCWASIKDIRRTRLIW